ncbi:LuxR C-terminal-related transcriptional regulator [uncultured Shimia sp.]|uniref:helix-turn-helix transcriptional regulator n=1 Tax=uncultured Shimia sp. TaxID=573152 RepID=UPI00260CA867|nr:LuxR C-terminal-related transcriptional regulator [uncultured Shimia sp.]
MSDTFQSRPLPRDTTTALVATVGTPGFGHVLMRHIRSAAAIANFGAFLVPDMSRPAPVLSLWAGEMSGYWFNRNARTILADDAMKQDIISRIRTTALGQLSVERWRPSPEDPINPIYQRDEVIERITVSSRTENAGVQSFYLRGKSSGRFTEDEVQRLMDVLPLVHELVVLRHRIVGSEAFHFATDARVTALRARDVGRFGQLSPREAEVCDQLLNGVSVAGSAVALGISDNSVRTLRKRAYAKLGVHSAMQIAALALNDST